MGGSRLALAVRYFDLALLAAALPVFLAADLPIAGYLVVAAVWLAALLVGLLDEREAGLAAAVLSAILFTVHFAGRFIARAMTPPEERI